MFDLNRTYRFSSAEALRQPLANVLDEYLEGDLFVKIFDSLAGNRVRGIAIKHRLTTSLVYVTENTPPVTYELIDSLTQAIIMLGVAV